MAEARALFIGLIQEALLEGDHSLHLSWPQRINGKDQSPAPPLADLLDLEPEILDSLRPAPVPKGLRRSEHLYVGQGPGSEDCSSQLQAQKRRSLVRDQAPLGPFDGTLGLSTEERIPLSVTRLERYVQCPARDWYANRLGLADEDERTEDANSLTRGSLLHDVLEKFVRESLEDYRKTVPPRDALAARLAQTAESAIADPRLQPSMSEDARNGLREHWLPGLLDDRPKGLLAAWLDREIERIPQRIPIAVEASLEGLHLAGHPLKGRIDRVDQADTDGLLIVDYKTGSPPTGKKVARGLALQGFLYTEGAALLWPNTGPRASVYTQISRADTLKDAAWLGDKDLIKSLSPSARPTVLDSEKHAQLLHHAEAAADALTRGVHHPTLATTEEAGCSYCEFRSICRFDDLRAQAISEDSQSCGPLETS